MSSVCGFDAFACCRCGHVPCPELACLGVCLVVGVLYTSVRDLHEWKRGGNLGEGALLGRKLPRQTRVTPHGTDEGGLCVG